MWRVPLSHRRAESARWRRSTTRVVAWPVPLRPPADDANTGRRQRAQPGAGRIHPALSNPGRGRVPPPVDTQELNWQPACSCYQVRAVWRFHQSPWAGCTANPARPMVLPVRHIAVQPPSGIAVTGARVNARATNHALVLTSCRRAPAPVALGLPRAADTPQTANTDRFNPHRAVFAGGQHPGACRQAAGRSSSLAKPPEFRLFAQRASKGSGRSIWGRDASTRAPLIACAS